MVSNWSKRGFATAAFLPAFAGILLGAFGGASPAFPATLFSFFLSLLSSFLESLTSPPSSARARAAAALFLASRAILAF